MWKNRNDLVNNDWDNMKIADLVCGKLTKK